MTCSPVSIPGRPEVTIINYGALVNIYDVGKDRFLAHGAEYLHPRDLKKRS
jgi:hypothetical protein